jgi:SAM-dependent methyltransferase
LERIVMKTGSQGDARDVVENRLQRALRVGKRVLPSSLAAWLEQSETRRPAMGRVRFGDFARTAPIDSYFGFGRGTPLDRFYIESFLDRNRDDIAGRVLEVDNSGYSQRFGAERVLQQDVLHVHPGNPLATIVGDISTSDVLPRDSFDCIVLTQTLQYIYDLRAAVAQLHSALKPGGVVLATLPGISQIDPDYSDGTWLWGFTAASASRLFEEAFQGGSVAVESHGNVFAAVSFLHGVALEEVPRAKLLVRDAAYPMIITVRAGKRLQDGSSPRGLG